MCSLVKYIFLICQNAAYPKWSEIIVDGKNLKVGTFLSFSVKGNILELNNLQEMLLKITNSVIAFKSCSYPKARTVFSTIFIFLTENLDCFYRKCLFLFVLAMSIFLIVIFIYFYSLYLWCQLTHRIIKCYMNNLIRNISSKFIDDCNYIYYCTKHRSLQCEIENKFSDIFFGCYFMLFNVEAIHFLGNIYLSAFLGNIYLKTELQKEQTSKAFQFTGFQL